MVRSKENFKSFTVNFPRSVIEEVDQICASNYTSRTSWLIRAAKHLLEKERISKTDEILARFSDPKKED